MNKALLDTDTLSEIGKGKHAGIVSNAKIYRTAFGYYSCSTITVLEVVRGYQKAQQLQRLNAFLASITPARNIRTEERVAPRPFPASKGWLYVRTGSSTTEGTEGTEGTETTEKEKSERIQVNEFNVS